MTELAEGTRLLIWLSKGTLWVRIPPDVLNIIKIKDMTTREICERYTRSSQGTSTTLAIMQDVLREQLPEYRRVWLQATVSGRTRFVITLFSEQSYEMRFCSIPNFRHFRPNENLDTEARNIDTMLYAINRACL